MLHGPLKYLALNSYVDIVVKVFVYLKLAVLRLIFDYLGCIGFLGEQLFWQ